MFAFVALYYEYHRAFCALKSEKIIDVSGHLLAFATGFRGPTSDTVLQNGLNSLVKEKWRDILKYL